MATGQRVSVFSDNAANVTYKGPKPSALRVFRDSGLQEDTTNVARRPLPGVATSDRIEWAAPIRNVDRWDAMAYRRVPSRKEAAYDSGRPDEETLQLSQRYRHKSMVRCISPTRCGHEAPRRIRAGSCPLAGSTS